MNPINQLAGQAISRGIPLLQHLEARRTVGTMLTEAGYVINHTPEGIIVIEDSANIQIEGLNDLLLSCDFYTDGFPRILENRDPRGNVQIEFTNLGPYDDMPPLEGDDEVNVVMYPHLEVLPERNLFDIFMSQAAEGFFQRHPVGEMRRPRDLTFSEEDIAKVTELLEAGDDVEGVKKLLAKKVPLSPKDYAMLWQKFHVLALVNIDSYPDLAKYCPLSVLEGTAETSELKATLIEHGAIFQNDCFIDLVQKDPQNIFALIKLYPEAARKCSRKALLDLLSADHVELFLKLLEIGATAHPDHLGVAICRGHLKAAHAIIDEDVDLSMRFGPSNTTFVCLAVEKNLGHLVDKLIKAKANVNQADVEEMTPLHFAAREGYSDIVRRLVNAGANVLAENKSGSTPRALASSNQHTAVAAMLLEPELAESIRQGKATQAMALLESGVSIHSIDRNGDTPLYLAMKHGLRECADILMRSLPRAYIEMMQGVLPKQKTTVLNQLKKAIQAKPQLAHECSSQNSTPFEVAFLLNNIPLAVQFMGQLTDVERIQGIAVLVSKYPHAIAAILDLFFEVDVGHFADASMCMMNTCPPDIEPQNLNIFVNEFKALTAADPTQKFLVNQRELSVVEVSSRVSLFLTNVNDELQFDGTPEKGTPAFKEQYKMIRVALSHVVLQLEKCKDDQAAYAKMVIDICRELAHAGPVCFTQYRETSSMLYNKYVLNIEPSAKNAFLEQLQQLRGMIVEGMTDEDYVYQPQNVHAIHYIKKTLGESLQLADRTFYTDDLPYDRAGFTNNRIPTNDVLYTSFLRRYKPSIIFDHIKAPLTDEGARSQYLDWAKVHLKEFVPDKKAYKEKKARLQAKQNELINKLLKAPELLSKEAILQYRSELEAVSRELSVEPVFGLTPVQSVKEDQQEALFHWLVDTALAVQPIPLVLALMKQKILAFRMHKEEVQTEKIANVLQLNFNPAQMLEMFRILV